MGKLIIFEGLDGSGKGTQTNLLCQALRARGADLRQITFPDYESDSSALVRMYLSGRFGQRPDDVNAYAASTFYAVDRFASYRRPGCLRPLHDQQRRAPVLQAAAHALGRLFGLAVRL